MINLVERGPLGSGGGNGDTSSILRDGIRMSTEPLLLSMSQTCVSVTDSWGQTKSGTGMQGRAHSKLSGAWT